MAINVEKFKKRILVEKARLEADQARLVDHTGETMSESTSELSDFDTNHPGDSGNVLVDREKDEALQANLDGMLAQVHDALQKIENGTYGACDRCGKQIGEARLEALPYATFCIDCQSRLENA